MAYAQKEKHLHILSGDANRDKKALNKKPIIILKKKALYYKCNFLMPKLLNSFFRKEVKMNKYNTTLLY